MRNSATDTQLIRKSSDPLKKREWIYCQQPHVYDINCDKCGGVNITWSEFQKLIWCFDCEIDTPGTSVIFGGPIPMGCCELMGISFDRIRLSDERLLKVKIKDGQIIYKEET